MSTEEDLRRIISEDPGNSAFAELADALRRSGRQAEAMDIALNGLSKNPGCHQGRLVLARLFFDRRQYPFAVRELEALQEALPESKTVARLLEKLSPGAKQKLQSAKAAPVAETVAESEFEFDTLDLIDSDEEKKH